MKPLAMEIARQIVQRMPDRGGIVSIDGPSGSGKTTLAEKVRGALKEFQRSSVVVGLDIRLRERAWRMAVQKRVVGDPLTDADEALIREMSPQYTHLKPGQKFRDEESFVDHEGVVRDVLEPLREFFESDGEEFTLTVRKPYDQGTKTILPERTYPPIRKNDIVIVEGKYANREELAPYYQFHIRLRDNQERVRARFEIRTRRQSPYDADRQVKFFDLSLGPSYEDVYAPRTLDLIDLAADIEGDDWFVQDLKPEQSSGGYEPKEAEFWLGDRTYTLKVLVEPSGTLTVLRASDGKEVFRHDMHKILEEPLKVTIGRDSSNKIFIPDPNMRISPFHAALTAKKTATGIEVTLMNIDAQNDTYIKGAHPIAPLPFQQETQLFFAPASAATPQGARLASKYRREINFLKAFMTKKAAPVFEELFRGGPAEARRRMKKVAKVDQTPVTIYDPMIERLFHQHKAGKFPDDGIIGEELATTRFDRRMWTIDPIDGTTDFEEAGDHFGTLTALYADGAPQVAAGYWPRLKLDDKKRKSLVTAQVDTPGIRLNGRLVKKAQIDKINRSKVIYIGSHPQAKKALRQALRKYFEQRGYTVVDSRAGGGEVAEMMLKGTAHLYIHLTPAGVDAPTNAFFAEKLGLKTSDRHGDSIFPIRFHQLREKLFFDSLIIGSPESHAEAMAAFQAIGDPAEDLPWTDAEKNMPSVQLVRHLNQQINHTKQRTEADPYAARKKAAALRKLRHELAAAVAPAAGLIDEHTQQELERLVQEEPFRLAVLDPETGALTRIKQIYDEKSKVGKSTLIGQSGPPGAGKSEGGKYIAEAVARQTGSEVVVLKEDNTLIQRDPVNLRGNGLQGKFQWEVRDRMLDSLRNGKSILKPSFDDATGGNLMISLDSKGNVVIHHGNRTIRIGYKQGNRTFTHEEILLLPGTEPKNLAEERANPASDTGVFVSGSTKFRIRLEDGRLVIGFQSMEIISVNESGDTAPVERLTEHEIDLLPGNRAMVHTRIPAGHDHLNPEANFALELVKDPSKADELRKAKPLKEFVRAGTPVVFDGQFAYLRLQDGKFVRHSGLFDVALNYRAPRIVRWTRDWGRSAERGRTPSQQLENAARFWERAGTEEELSVPSGVAQGIIQVNTTDLAESVQRLVHYGREQWPAYKSLLRQLGIQPEKIDEWQRENLIVPKLLELLGDLKGSITKVRTLDGLEEYQVGDFLFHVEEGRSSLSEVAVERNRQLFKRMNSVMGGNTIVDLSGLGFVTTTNAGRKRFGEVSVWNKGELITDRLNALAKKGDNASIQEGERWIDGFIAQEIEMHRRGVVDTKPSLSHRRILPVHGQMTVTVVSPEANLVMGLEALEIYGKHYIAGSESEIIYLSSDVQAQVPEAFKPYYRKRVLQTWGNNIANVKLVRQEILEGFYKNHFETILPGRERTPVDRLPDYLKAVAREKVDIVPVMIQFRNWDVEHPALFKERLSHMRSVYTAYFIEQTSRSYYDHIHTDKGTPQLLWTALLVHAYPDKFNKFYQLLKVFYNELLDSPDTLEELTDNEIRESIQEKYGQGYRQKGFEPPAIDSFSWKSFDHFLRKTRSLSSSLAGARLASFKINDRAEWLRLQNILAKPISAVMTDLDGTVTKTDQVTGKVANGFVRYHHANVRRLAQLADSGVLVAPTTNRRPQKAKAYAEEILAKTIQPKNTRLEVYWASGFGGMDLVAKKEFKSFNLHFSDRDQARVIKALVQSRVIPLSHRSVAEKMDGKMNVYIHAPPGSAERNKLIQNIRQTLHDLRSSGLDLKVMDGGEHVLSILPRATDKARPKKYIKKRYGLTESQILKLVDQPQTGRADAALARYDGIHVGDDITHLPRGVVSTKKAIGLTGPQAAYWVLRHANFVPLSKRAKPDSAARLAKKLDPAQTSQLDRFYQTLDDLDRREFQRLFTFALRRFLNRRKPTNEKNQRRIDTLKNDYGLSSLEDGDVILAILLAKDFRGIRHLNNLKKVGENFSWAIEAGGYLFETEFARETLRRAVTRRSSFKFPSFSWIVYRLAENVGAIPSLREGIPEGHFFINSQARLLWIKLPDESEDLKVAMPESVEFVPVQGLYDVTLEEIDPPSNIPPLELPRSLDGAAELGVEYWLRQSEEHSQRLNSAIKAGYTVTERRDKLTPDQVLAFKRLILRGLEILKNEAPMEEPIDESSNDNPVTAPRLQDYLDNLNDLYDDSGVLRPAARLSEQAIRERINALNQITDQKERFESLFEIIDSYSQEQHDGIPALIRDLRAAYFILSDDEIKMLSRTDPELALNYLLYRNLLDGRAPVLASDLSGTLVDFKKGSLYPGVARALRDYLNTGPAALITGDPFKTVQDGFLRPFEYSVALSDDQRNNLLVLTLLGLDSYQHIDLGPLGFKRESLLAGISKSEEEEINRILAEVSREFDLENKFPGRKDTIQPRPAADGGVSIAFLPAGMLNAEDRASFVFDPKNAAMLLAIAESINQNKRLKNINSMRASKGELPIVASKGGVTTVDIVPTDKGEALKAVRIKLDMRPTEYFVFLGDNIFPEGNDYSALKTAEIALQVGSKNDADLSIPGHIKIFSKEHADSGAAAKWIAHVSHIRRVGANYGIQGVVESRTAARLANVAVPSSDMIAQQGIWKTQGRNGKNAFVFSFGAEATNKDVYSADLPQPDVLVVDMDHLGSVPKIESHLFQSLFFSAFQQGVGIQLAKVNAELKALDASEDTDKAAKIAVKKSEKAAILDRAEQLGFEEVLVPGLLSHKLTLLMMNEDQKKRVREMVINVFVGHDEEYLTGKILEFQKSHKSYPPYTAEAIGRMTDAFDSARSFVFPGGLFHQASDEKVGELLDKFLDIYPLDRGDVTLTKGQGDTENQVVVSLSANRLHLIENGTDYDLDRAALHPREIERTQWKEAQVSALKDILAQSIRKPSRDKAFLLSFGAADPTPASGTQDYTNFAVIYNGRMILVDPSKRTLRNLDRRSLMGRVGAIYLSHNHYDHIGGVLDLVYRKLNGELIRPIPLIAAYPVYTQTIELISQMTGNPKDRIERILKHVRPTKIEGEIETVGLRGPAYRGMQFKLTRTYNHPIATYGFRLNTDHGTMAYLVDSVMPAAILGDQQPNPYYQEFVQFFGDVDVLVSENGVPGVHITPAQLKTAFPEHAAQGSIYTVHSSGMQAETGLHRFEPFSIVEVKTRQQKAKDVQRIADELKALEDRLTEAAKRGIASRQPLKLTEPVRIRIAQLGRERILEQGEVIFSAGEPVSHNPRVYFILQGDVNAGDGLHIYPGEIVGELAVLRKEIPETLFKAQLDLKVKDVLASLVTTEVIDGAPRRIWNIGVTPEFLSQRYSNQGDLAGRLLDLFKQSSQPPRNSTVVVNRNTRVLELDADELVKLIRDSRSEAAGVNEGFAASAEEIMRERGRQDQAWVLIEQSLADSVSGNASGNVAARLANNLSRPIKPVSGIWRQLLMENQVPLDGTIVEVAPGYETKIGDALALLEFKGTVVLIEPDQAAASSVLQAYQKLLPQATVKAVAKLLQDVEIGKDIPAHVDALVANHPFDDMVIASALRADPSFFSGEREAGTTVTPQAKELYDQASDKDYIHGILATLVVWKDLVQKLKPAVLIVSQYPSHKLELKGLIKRQNSGFIVIDLLRDFYENYLAERYQDKSFGTQGDPAWWIVAGRPYKDLARDLASKPDAMKRLGEPVFAAQNARQLDRADYDVVYADGPYFEEAGYGQDAREQARNFAMVLDNESAVSPETIKVHADRQKDRTGIALNGNSGSGRSVYYGNPFNVIGVGKTTLVTNEGPRHSSGRMDLVGALRRLVLSKWINSLTNRAVRHPVVIARKETAHFSWSPNPVPLALLVRVDDGDLDRLSHIEYSPDLPLDFEKVLDEYAKLDAEYFAYRMMLGAWSTGNYSLTGKIIDLETASFTKYRGPYHTASSKHEETFFGYEGLGFIRILEQIADVKGIKNIDVKQKFYEARRRYLTHNFLLLLGVDKVAAASFLSKHSDQVMALSDLFEKLAKKISPKRAALSLYRPIAESEDPSLLDMTHLFRHLAEIEEPAADRQRRALDLLIRKTALEQIQPGVGYEPQPTRRGLDNKGEFFIKDHAVVTHDQLEGFLSETKGFIGGLFDLVDTLRSEGILPEALRWREQLQIANRDFPVMSELNHKLMYWVEGYRLGRINAETLGLEIEKLSQLPDYPTGENFDLKDIPLLDYLKRTHPEPQDLSGRFKTVDYASGEVIVREGNDADSLFILVQGTAKVIVEERTIGKISNRGALIGEAVVLPEVGKRTATVVAETPVRLLQIYRSDLEALMRAIPDLRKLLTNVLTQKRSGVSGKALDFEIFKGINPESLRLFLADKAMEKHFAPGETLIEQGKKTEGVYVLIHGSVVLNQATTGLQIQPISLHDKPLTQGLFGERSIIFDEGAVSAVTANENVLTLFIGADDFRELLDWQPRLLGDSLKRIGDYSESNKDRGTLIDKLNKQLQRPGSESRASNPTAARLALNAGRRQKVEGGNQTLQLSALRPLPQNAARLAAPGEPGHERRLSIERKLETAEAVLEEAGQMPVSVGGARLAKIRPEQIVIGEAGIDASKLDIKGVTDLFKPDKKSADLEKLIIDAKPVVLLVRSTTQIKREDLIDELYRNGLRYIVRMGHGTDNVNVAYAESKGIQVIGTKGSELNVAELAILMMMTVVPTKVAGQSNRSLPKFLPVESWEAAFKEKTKNLLPLDPYLHQLKANLGRVVKPIRSEDAAASLKGMRVGVIGATGTIGRIFAAMAHALGMEVWVYSPSLENKPKVRAKFEKLGYRVASSKEEIYANVDFVVPFTGLIEKGKGKTKGMFGKRAVTAMLANPRFKALVNVDRGELVVESQIKRLIDGGGQYLADAAPKSKFLRENTVYLPHIAGSTPEGKKRVVANTNEILNRIVKDSGAVGSVIQKIQVTESVFQKISDTVLDQARKKLAGKKSRFQMIPSRIQLPDNIENLVGQKALYIDIGGSHVYFGVSEIVKGEDGPIQVRVPVSDEYILTDNEIQNTDGTQKFKNILDRVASFIKKNSIDTRLIGVTFSFPHKDGKILPKANGAKKFNWKGVIGKKIQKIVEQGLQKRGIKGAEVAAVVNDTEASLVLGWTENQDIRVGVINGTGMNHALLIHGKIYNVESAAAELPAEIMTEFDRQFYSRGVEDIIAGKNLGEIARRVLLQDIQDGTLFSGKITARGQKTFNFPQDDDDKEKGLDSKYISKIAGAATLDQVRDLLRELGVDNASDEDADTAQRLFRAFLERSSQVSAAMIDGFSRVEGLSSGVQKNIGAAVDGSIWEKAPAYVENTQKALIAHGNQTTIALTPGASQRGASVVAIFVKASQAARLSAVGGSEEARYFIEKLKDDASLRQNHILIIGAGPAGLRVADQLIKENQKRGPSDQFQITIFDRNAVIGGLGSYGIPPTGRQLILKNSIFALGLRVLAAFQGKGRSEPTAEQILASGVRFFGNIGIGRDIAFEELESLGVPLFIATGAQKPRRLGVEGENLGNVVSATSEYFRSVNTHWLIREKNEWLSFFNQLSIKYIGKPFLATSPAILVGGGNVVSDAALSLLSQRPDRPVVIYYRGPEWSMPNLGKEYRTPLEDKNINIVGLHTVERYVDSDQDGKVDHVVFRLHKIVGLKLDAEGQPIPVKSGNHDKPLGLPDDRDMQQLLEEAGVEIPDALKTKLDPGIVYQVEVVPTNQTVDVPTSLVVEAIGDEVEPLSDLPMTRTGAFKTDTNGLVEGKNNIWAVGQAQTQRGAVSHSYGSADKAVASFLQRLAAPSEAARLASLEERLSHAQATANQALEKLTKDVANDYEQVRFELTSSGESSLWVPVRKPDMSQSGKGIKTWVYQVDLRIMDPGNEAQLQELIEAPFIRSAVDQSQYMGFITGLMRELAPPTHGARLATDFTAKTQPIANITVTPEGSNRVWVSVVSQGQYISQFSYRALFEMPFSMNRNPESIAASVKTQLDIHDNSIMTQGIVREVVDLEAMRGFQKILETREMDGYQVITAIDGDDQFEIATLGGNVVDLQLGGVQRIYHEGRDASSGRVTRLLSDPSRPVGTDNLPMRGGIPFMAPWTGRRPVTAEELAANPLLRVVDDGRFAIHGYFDKMRWTYVNTWKDKEGVYVMISADTQDEPRLPKTKTPLKVFRTIMFYQKKFKIETTLIGNGRVGVGDHPFFIFKDPAQTIAQIIAGVVHDKTADGLTKSSVTEVAGSTDFVVPNALGEPLDRTFTNLGVTPPGIIPASVFTFRTETERLTVTQDTGYRKLHLWVPQNSPLEHVVGIEPMTDEPGAQNTQLDSQKPLTLRWSLEIQPVGARLADVRESEPVTVDLTPSARQFNGWHQMDYQLEIHPGVYGELASESTEKHRNFLIDRLKVIKADSSKPRRVLILGAGSGWEIFEVLKQFPGSEIVAVDRNPRAIKNIEANLLLNSDLIGGAHIQAVESDLFEALQDAGLFDLVIFHMPYPERYSRKIHSSQGNTHWNIESVKDFFDQLPKYLSPQGEAVVTIEDFAVQEVLSGDSPVFFVKEQQLVVSERHEYHHDRWPDEQFYTIDRYSYAFGLSPALGARLASFRDLGDLRGKAWWDAMEPERQELLRSFLGNGRKFINTLPFDHDNPKSHYGHENLTVEEIMLLVAQNSQYADGYLIHAGDMTGRIRISNGKFVSLKKLAGQDPKRVHKRYGTVVLHPDLPKNKTYIIKWEGAETPNGAGKNRIGKRPTNQGEDLKVSLEEFSAVRQIIGIKFLTYMDSKVKQSQLDNIGREIKHQSIAAHKAGLLFFPEELPAKTVYGQSTSVSNKLKDAKWKAKNAVTMARLLEKFEVDYDVFKGGFPGEFIKGYPGADIRNDLAEISQRIQGRLFMMLSGGDSETFIRKNNTAKVVLPQVGNFAGRYVWQDAFTHVIFEPNQSVNLTRKQVKEGYVIGRTKDEVKVLIAKNLRGGKGVDPRISAKARYEALRNIEIYKPWYEWLGLTTEQAGLDGARLASRAETLARKVRILSFLSRHPNSFYSASEILGKLKRKKIFQDEVKSVLESLKKQGLVEKESDTKVLPVSSVIGKSSKRDQVVAVYKINPQLIGGEKLTTRILRQLITGEKKMGEFTPFGQLAGVLRTSTNASFDYQGAGARLANVDRETVALGPDKIYLHVYVAQRKEPGTFRISVTESGHGKLMDYYELKTAADRTIEDLLNEIVGNLERHLELVDKILIDHEKVLNIVKLSSLAEASLDAGSVVSMLDEAQDAVPGEVSKKAKQRGGARLATETSFRVPDDLFGRSVPAEKPFDVSLAGARIAVANANKFSIGKRLQFYLLSSLAALSLTSYAYASTEGGAIDIRVSQQEIAGPEVEFGAFSIYPSQFSAILAGNLDLKKAPLLAARANIGDLLKALPSWESREAEDRIWGGLEKDVREANTSSLQEIQIFIPASVVKNFVDLKQSLEKARFMARVHKIAIKLVVTEGAQGLSVSEKDYLKKLVSQVGENKITVDYQPLADGQKLAQVAVARISNRNTLVSGQTKLVLIAPSGDPDEVTGLLGAVDADIRSSVIAAGIEIPQGSEASQASASFAGILAASILKSIDRDPFVLPANLGIQSSVSQSGINVLIFRPFMINKALAAARLSRQADIAA